MEYGRLIYDDLLEGFKEGKTHYEYGAAYNQSKNGSKQKITQIVNFEKQNLILIMTTHDQGMLTGLTSEQLIEKLSIDNFNDLDKVKVYAVPRGFNKEDEPMKPEAYILSSIKKVVAESWNSVRQPSGPSSNKMMAELVFSTKNIHAKKFDDPFSEDSMALLQENAFEVALWNFNSNVRGLTKIGEDYLAESQFSDNLMGLDMLANVPHLYYEFKKLGKPQGGSQTIKIITSTLKEWLGPSLKLGGLKNIHISPKHKTLRLSFKKIDMSVALSMELLNTEVKVLSPNEVVEFNHKLENDSIDCALDYVVPLIGENIKNMNW